MTTAAGDAGGLRARLVLALVSLALVAATLGLDLPRASQGEFWGDGATYYAMAWSLARDLDLRFDARGPRARSAPSTRAARRGSS